MSLFWNLQLAPDRGHGDAEQRRPRVVILDSGSNPRVEVLDLLEDAALGSSFCHAGTSWRVTDVRPSSRVLIARPDRH
jgi:hypothetical protein